MGERTVHEAAVEAFVEGSGIILNAYWRPKVEAGIAALAASAEVRAGLVRELLASTDVWFLGADDPRNDAGSKGFRPWPLADVVRAALAGPEAS